MTSSFHQTMSGLAASVHRPNQRTRLDPKGAIFKESARSRVIAGVNAIVNSLPLTHTDACGRGHAEHLVNAVILSLIQGNLKAGDPLPDPPELARACHLPRHEVLAALGSLLSGRIIEQDRYGALRIRRGAAPTIEMKQQAFLARARELVGEACQWQLPIECLDSLFYRATHEKT